MSQGTKYKHSPRFTSVAVQASSPTKVEAVHSTRRSSPMALPRTRPPPGGGGTNAVEDLRARVDLLSDAIDRFKREARFTKDALGTTQKPAATKPDSSSGIPPSAPTDAGVLPIPHLPSRRQLPTETLSSQSSSNESKPDFQHILRVEHECIRYDTPSIFAAFSSIVLG